jgi:hypothetical protein
MWLWSSDWWALNSEMTALSSRAFLASLACCPARMDRQTATAAAAAAIAAKTMSRLVELMASAPPCPRSS